MGFRDKSISEMLAGTLISRWIDRYHEVMEQIDDDYTPRALSGNELALFDLMADETLKVLSEDMLAAWKDLSALHEPTYNLRGFKVCASCEGRAQGITHGAAGKISYPCPTAVVIHKALERLYEDVYPDL